MKMKRVALSVVLSVGMVGVGTGCAHRAVAPPPPLVNQINDFDGQTYRALIGLSATINSLKQSVTSDANLASLQPAVDAAGNQYNLAMLAWKTYHAAATAANQQAAQRALAQAQSSVDTLSKQVTAK